MTARHLLTTVCIVAVLVTTAAHAQSYDRAAVDMFKGLQRQPNVLARYHYLARLQPRLSADDRILAA